MQRHGNLEKDFKRAFRTPLTFVTGSTYASIVLLGLPLLWQLRTHTHTHSSQSISLGSAAAYLRGISTRKT